MRLLLLAFLLCSTQVWAQEIFQGYYGKSGNDAGHAIVQLDTGYAAFGVTHNIGSGTNADFLGIVYDRHNQSYIHPPLAFTGSNGFSGSIDILHDAITTGGNMIIATGETSAQRGGTRHQDIMLLRLDYITLSSSLFAFGEVAAATEAELGSDIGTSLIAASDGGFVVAGSNGEQPLLLKTDNNLNLQWSRSLNMPGGGKAFDVIEDNTGSYLVVGTAKENNTTSSSIFVYRFASDGTFINGTLFGLSASDQEARTIQQTQDNGYLITGNHNAGTNGSQLIVIKLKPDFTPEWSYTYASGGTDVAASGMEAIEGDGYIIAGNVARSGHHDALLLRLKPDGSVHWSRLYGAEGDELIHDLSITRDQSYVLSGSTSSVSLGVQGSDVYLIKTNIYGRSGVACPQDSVSFTRNFAPLSVDPAPQNPLTINLASWSWNYDLMASAFLPTYQSSIICNATIPPLQITTKDDDTICSGRSTTLGGEPSTASGGTPPYAYSWMPGNLPGENPVVSPLSNTTYYVTVTDRLGLTAKDTVSIDVVDYSAGFSGLQTDYCTSSPMSILTPDTLTGYFTGPGTFWNGSFWYFDPQTAGVGTHEIAYINRCDTTTEITTIHPAPCISDVVTDTTSGSVSVPQGIFTYCDGTIHITNVSNITRIDTFGVAIKMAGHSNETGYRDGHVDSARFNIPSGIVMLEDKTIYVADNFNHAVRQIKNDTVTTIAGAPPPTASSGTLDNPIGTSARFSSPYGVSYDRKRNCLYISQEKRIRKIDLNDPNYPVTTIAGGGAIDVVDATHALDAQFHILKHLTVEGDYISFPDYDKRVVYRLNLNTDTVERFSGVYNAPGDIDGPRLNARFVRPVGVSANCNGDIYITDESMNKIREIRNNVVYSFEDPAFMLNQPQGISVFVKGFIDIANKGNNNILRMSVNDWDVGPWIGLDTNDFTYCLGAETDTLQPIYDCGYYSGPGISQLADGRYIFTPPTTTGSYQIFYHYEVGYCSAQTSVTLHVADNPVLVMPDTVGICAGASARLYSTETWQSHSWNTGATSDTLLVSTEGAYWLEISDSNNCFDRDTTYVLARPNPTVEAGSVAPICPGETFTLGGTPSASGGETPYTFAWSPALHLGDSTLANPTGSITSPTLFHLHVTDRYYCAGRDSVQVDLSATPFADAGSNDTICEGTSTSLGGSPAGPVGVSYVWSNDSYLNNAGVSNPLASPPIGTTQFILSVIDAGCEAHDTVLITVTENPVAKAGSDDTLCSGASIVIGDIASGGTFPYSYSWVPATGLNNPALATPTATPATPTTYTVAVTDANGCENTDEMTLFVSNPNIFAGTDQYICLGDSSNIGNEATNGYPPYSYTWIPATGLSNSGIATPDAYPDTTTQYSVLTRDEAGCEARDTIQITVHALPTASVSFTDTASCAGDTIQLTATGGVAYIWSPSTRISFSNTATPLVFPMDTTRYLVRVSDTNTCSDTASVLILANNPDVFIHPYPDTMICAGASVAISASAPDGINYTWTPATGLNNPNTATPIATPASTTTYTVSANTSLGCPAMDTVRILVSVGLSANAGQNDTICTGSHTIIGGDTIASGGLPGYTYHWSTGDTIQHPVVEPTDVKTAYRLTVTDLAGCTNTDTTQVTLWSLPSVDAGSHDTICFGDSTSTGGSPTAGGTLPPYLYAWTPTTSINSTDAPNPIVFSNNTGKDNITTNYSVVVTDGRGCTDSDHVNITFLPMPQTSYSYDSLCLGEKDTLEAYGGVEYNWLPSNAILAAYNNKAVIFPDTTTRYEVIIASAFCPPDTLDVTILVHPLPEVIAGPDTNIFIGEPLTLYAKGGISYVWSPADILLDPNTTQNPRTRIISSTHFQVTVTNRHNCSAIDTVAINVQDKFDLYVPNAFAPQGDVDVNRQVCVNGVGLARVQFSIFNKWGQLVFSSEEIDACWDGYYQGRLQDAQTFGYILEAEDYHGEVYQQKGTIVLIK